MKGWPRRWRLRRWWPGSTWYVRWLEATIETLTDEIEELTERVERAESEAKHGGK